jgi:hypothetical protein
MIVAQAINILMRVIPPEDRSGFLFALSIGPMMKDGWSKDRIKEEILKGLDVAWSNRGLVVNTNLEEEDEIV